MSQKFNNFSLRKVFAQTVDQSAGFVSAFAHTVSGTVVSPYDAYLNGRELSRFLRLG